MKAVVLLVVLGVLVGLFVFWIGDSSEVESGNAVEPVPADEVFLDNSDVTLLSDAPFAMRFGDEGISEEEELELIQMAYGDYLSFVKEDYRPPLGDNRDFVKILTGGNPYRIASISPRHPRINEAGELVDRRGFPYVIHALSGRQIEVRAPGPDGIAWTNDDLVKMTIGGKETRERVLGE